MTLGCLIGTEPPDPATAGRAERPRLSNTGGQGYMESILVFEGEFIQWS